MALLLAGSLAGLAAGRAFADPPLIARSFVAPAPAPAPSPANPLLRVLLLQTAVIEPLAYGGPLRLRDAEGRELLLLPAGERLRISREGDALRLERPDSSDPRLAATQRLALQTLILEPALAEAEAPAGGLRAVLAGRSDPAAPGLVGLGRRVYRGSLLLRPDGTALQALNLIPLELYLPSVVGSEMPARWPAAALRAQAVAARTYALAQLKPAASYDLKATVASQAYLGLEAETDSTRAAVAATRSLVLSYGGALIDAVFHSSSGGSTENSGELWNRQLPYLVSVPDADDNSPWREWSLRFEPEQLRRAFRETAGASRIEVLSASSTGRVRRARVIGPAGSLDLTGAELRQRLGLRSTLVRFRFEQPPAAALSPAAGPEGGITAALTSASGRSAGTAAGAEGAAPFRSALSRWAAAEAPGGTTGSRGAGRLPSPPPPPPLPITAAAEAGEADPGWSGPIFLQAQPPLPSLEVVGRGFGHGVGMSQWGAYSLALRGKDYGAILRHYYRGVELVPYAGR